MRISDCSSDVCSSDLTAIDQVTVLARQGELPQVRLDESGLIISPLKAVTPPATEITRRAAYDRLPRVKITDLLLEVDAWTGFSECFVHRRSGREIGRASGRERVCQYV